MSYFSAKDEGVLFHATPHSFLIPDRIPRPRKSLRGHGFGMLTSSGRTPIGGEQIRKGIWSGTA
jgi:hypothetical protein